MISLIEKNAAKATLLVLIGTFLIFLTGGLRLASLAGVFTGKQAVIENDKRITRQNLLNASAPDAAFMKP